MRCSEVIVAVWWMALAPSFLINLQIYVLSHQSPDINHLFAMASRSWGRPPQGSRCSGSPWKSPNTAEPELQGSQLSKHHCDMACPHHSAGGSSASSKDPDYGLTCIFSQTLSHWKARAELNGRT